MTKVYLHSVPVAFLKWKTITKIKETDYKAFAEKTKKMGKLIEIYLDGRKQRTQNAFTFWKFQVENNMPFYRRRTVGSVIAKATAHANTYGLIKNRIHGNWKTATPFDIMIKLANVREILDRKFKHYKRGFFRRLKMYQDLEKMILHSNSTLLLRTMRLNETNYYDNVRRCSRKE